MCSSVVMDILMTDYLDVLYFSGLSSDWGCDESVILDGTHAPAIDEFLSVMKSKCKETGTLWNFSIKEIAKEYRPLISASLRIFSNMSWDAPP